MNNLSDELISNIFSNLRIPELLNNCRLVCKQWKLIVDKLNNDELIIIMQNEYFDRYWTSTSKPFNNQNIVYCYKLDFFNSKASSSFRRLFSNNLRKFKIDYYIIETEFDIEYLNLFNQLEHLELNYNLSLKKDVNLRLANLHTLQFNLISLSSEYHAIIESRKLNTFICYYLMPFKIRHPKSIKHLEFEMYTILKEHDLKEANICDLSIFKNLEILKTNDIHILDNLNLYKLEKLNQLNCLIRSPNYLMQIENQLIKIFGSLLKQIKSRKGEFNLFLNSVKLTDEDEIKDYNFSRDCLSVFYDFYSLLDNEIKWYREIDYNQVQDLFQAIPRDFCTKFSQIQTITATKIDSTRRKPNKFLLFINKCPNLIELVLNNPTVNQEFYDQLFDNTNTITRIELTEREQSIDFRFILKFKFLAEFITNQIISIETASSIVQNSAYLFNFEFQLDKKNTIMIKKINKNHYLLRQSIDEKEKLTKYNVDMNDLIDLCKSIKIN